jgi:hypothetical protein
MPGVHQHVCPCLSKAQCPKTQLLILCPLLWVGCSSCRAQGPLGMDVSIRTPLNAVCGAAHNWCNCCQRPRCLWYTAAPCTAPQPLAVAFSHLLRALPPQQLYILAFAPTYQHIHASHCVIGTTINHPICSTQPSPPPQIKLSRAHWHLHSPIHKTPGSAVRILRW